MLMWKRGIVRSLLISIGTLCWCVLCVTLCIGPTALSVPEMRASVSSPMLGANRASSLLISSLLVGETGVISTSVLALVVISRYGMTPVRRLSTASMTVLFGPSCGCV